MWVETARIEQHLRDGMEIYFSVNFSIYMKAILKDSLNNEGDRVPTGHLMSQKEAFSTRIELYPV